MAAHELGADCGWQAGDHCRLVHRGPVARQSASHTASRRRSSLLCAKIPTLSNTTPSTAGTATAVKITRTASCER